MGVQKWATGEASPAWLINVEGLVLGVGASRDPGSPTLGRPRVTRGSTVGFYSVVIPNAGATRVDISSVFSPRDDNSPYCWDGDGPSCLSPVPFPSPIRDKGLFRTQI